MSDLEKTAASRMADKQSDELLVAADLCEENGFDRAAKVLRDQIHYNEEMLIWGSEVLPSFSRH